MSDAMPTLPGPSDLGQDEFLAQVADAVHDALPGAAGDALIGRIGEILAVADLERIAVENEQLQHELELLQSVDGLTGLRNRQRFFEDLKREVAAARRYESELSLVVLDVAGLRDVNETRGFDAGDRLLLTLGELLLTRLRVSDIAARIGDDDFAAILPHTPLSGAHRLAERIAETLGDWVDIGVAGLDASVTSGADLLERADRDLAASKHARANPPAA